MTPAEESINWLSLILSGVSLKGVELHVKSSALQPVPVSWSDIPAGVLGASLTPMSLDVIPLARPSTAVKNPS